tara:strand:- start:6413 stop:7675 length:1263 start_codon:yes stop_codon:yes gene_type:complete
MKKIYKNNLINYEILRKKKYKDKRFDINSYDFFDYLFEKRKNFTEKFYKPNFFLHFLLTILTLITIFKAKISGINKAHYFVVANNLNVFRSQNIIDKIKNKKVLNIIRVNSFLTALKVFFKYDNVIYHNSLNFFSKIFFFNNFKDDFEKINYINLKKIEFYKKIFAFLKLKRLIMIDDYREIQQFLFVCKTLNIFTIAYQHSRFSKYRVSLKYQTFDKYIVWNDYFKRQLIKINQKYKGKIIINNFRNFKAIKKPIDYSKLNIARIIYFVDDNLDYKTIKKCLYKIISLNNIELLIKLKNNSLSNFQLIEFAHKNRLKLLSNISLKDLVKKNKPDIFLAAHSNVLIESSLYNCTPILLKSNNDYSYDLVSEKLVFSLNYKDEFQKKIKYFLSDKTFKKKIYKKIWNIKNIKNENFLKYFI